MTVLVRNAEVGGALVNVLIDGATIAAVGPTLPPDADVVIDADGGALLPGLHDHHIHLLALAAALESVDCSSSLDGLVTAAGTNWIRGVGYHESVAGPLDRHVLDNVVPDRPVRVQHRSGALWMLNSFALQLVESVLDHSPDVERDTHGRPNGRLWRFDERLRRALPDEPPDVAAAARLLNGFGITGITDATPDLAPPALELLAGIGSLANVTLLGAPTGLPNSGPRKLLLRDHDLPTYNDLLDVIAETHSEGRPVAVHCVTRESLLLTLVVFDAAGVLPGDRIEHASVVPEGVAAKMAASGIAVVTQPSLLRLRGDDYLADVPPDDRACLYPFASLLAAGVTVAASSDAPYGDPDPWKGIEDAVQRVTSSGRVIGPDERVSARTALAGFLSAPDRPGGPLREVRPGSAADLVLLDAPLDVVLSAPSAQRVRSVFVSGRPVR